ncbi:MAG: hypothetical protein ACQEUT_01620 [Bacillota bacterium]
MEFIADIWMLLPIWGRGAVVLLILLTIAKPVILKVLPGLLKSLVYLIEKLAYLIFTVIITGMGFYVTALLKKGRKNFQRISKLEMSMQNSVRKLKVYHSNLRAASFKYYGRSSLFAAAVLAFTLFYWPQAALSQKWDNMDSWMIEEKMKQPRMGHKVAFENMKSKWSERKQKTTTASAEKQSVRMQLKKSETGGTLRREPVENLSTENVITQIGPGEELLFLQEEQELGGILWYKVQMANQQVGWMSSNILEPITQ